MFASHSFGGEKQISRICLQTQLLDITTKCSLDATNSILLCKDRHARCEER